MTANHNNFDSTESEAHPVETTEETIMLDENVSILSASEGDSSIVADLEMHEDVKQPEEVVEIVDVEGDRDFNAELSFRTIDLSRASYIDKKTRRVRIAVSSEQPVERSFGKEVLSHRAEDIDMSFMNSGTAPLLLDHDMTKVIGKIEEFKLDEEQRRTVAISGCSRWN